MSVAAEDPRADATAVAAEPERWPLWQRVVFRFLFVYAFLYITPWQWFYRVPGVGWAGSWWSRAVDWAVRASNSRFFHVRETLVPPNGSGDTSWNWAQLWLYLSVAALACLVWSVLDRRRAAYPRLGYWLRTLVRYFVASVALSYGIIKLFGLQMVFPSLSQLSTPLGDLLPMRLSWLFIGYSAKYQFFSGLMETIAGALLLFRPTVTLGLFVAAGAFLNVVLINLSYDVPVKLFATHILLATLLLLLWDARRLFGFLVLNRAAPPTTAYDPYFTRGWRHWVYRGLKLALVVQLLILPLYASWQRYGSVTRTRNAIVQPFGIAIYDVRTFALNGDTIPPWAPDSIRWRDVIFDSGSSGSVGTTDTLFWQRYRRGYFRFSTRLEDRTASVWKNSAAFDSTFLFTMRYEQPDSATILLWAGIGDDSVYVELTRSNRTFQLAERQFHWLSEYNR